MTWRLREHPEVAADIDGVVLWLLETASAERALTVHAAILDRIAQLATLPHCGTVRSEILPGLRIVATARKAVIAFTVHDDAREVRILLVTYGGQDWLARLPGRTFDEMES